MRGDVRVRLRPGWPIWLDASKFHGPDDVIEADLDTTACWIGKQWAELLPDEDEQPTGSCAHSPTWLRGEAA